jgi:glycosyltransferase involved in cell wall biosynthesis
VTQDVPFISVIVPTHARKTMLERLLSSLLRQDYPPHRYEIIVVHNWTDDGTEELLAKHIGRNTHPSIFYYRKNYNGPAASRQFGAKSARGSILAFIDDDCEPDAQWLKAGAAAMKSGVGVVQGRTLPRPDQPRRYFEKTVSVTSQTPWFETCNIFYLKQAFEQVGGFSPEFYDRFLDRFLGGDDTDLGWKVMHSGWKRDFSEQALVFHEIFAQSIWAWHREVMYLVIWPLLVKKWPQLRQELCCGYFLNRQSAGFAIALVGALGAVLFHWAGLFLVIPYLIIKICDSDRFHNPLVLIARIVIGLPRAMLIFLILCYGSIKYRSLVL